MRPLSRTALGSFGPNVTEPKYDRDRLRPGVVHFGVGNFHRVHQAVAIDACLHHPEHEGWAISGVGLTDGPTARAKAEAYRLQDNLYTVTQLASPDPRDTQVVGAMLEYLHAPQRSDTVLARLVDAATRIVSLTITEGGYHVDEASGAFRLNDPDIQRDLAASTPTTAFGYIASGLARRRQAGLPPFTVMSCDNLARNGDTARLAVTSFARAYDPSLADWIETHGAFPNSMVDRIAPHVTEADRQHLAQMIGVDDLLPAICEPYTSWVIEDRFCAGRPRLELAGVVFSDEVPAYVAVKGRLSNAAHVLMAYPALLMGARYVDEAMRLPGIPRLLQNFWDRDAHPLVAPPSGYSIPVFTQKVLERFANPAIKDQLLRVASDGASKIVVFHGRTIAELIASGRDVMREAFLIACFARYVRGVDDRGARFEAVEPHIGKADWDRLNGGDPFAVLDIAAFRGLALRQSERFLSAFQRICLQLEASGAAATLAQLLV